jgi:hypothetical protein
MYCTHCGKYNPEDSRFCEHCGKVMRNKASKKESEEFTAPEESELKNNNKKAEHTDSEINKKNKHIVIIGLVVVMAIVVIMLILHDSFSGNHNDNLGQTLNQESTGRNTVSGESQLISSISPSESEPSDNNASLWDENQHGIIALEGGGNSGTPLSLVLLNPVDLSVIAQKALPVNLNMTRNSDGKAFTLVTLSNNTPLGQPMFAFSGNFQYIAVTFAPNSDGSQHIGYYNLENSDVTDISPNTPSGFSSQVTVDTSPMFDPTEPNILLFQRNGQNYQYDLNTQISKPSNLTQNIYVSSYTMCYLINEGNGYNGCQLQDNTHTTSTSYLSPINNGTYALALFTGNGDNAQINSVMSSGDNTVDCGPDFWLDSNTLLCSVSDNSNFSKVDLGVKSQLNNGVVNAYYQVPDPTNLLPSNGRQNTNPILSYDGKTIIFQSTLGSTTNAYSIPSSGGQPKQIAQLGSSNSPLLFLEWR